MLWLVTRNRDRPDIGMAHFEPLLISSPKRLQQDQQVLLEETIILNCVSPLLTTF